MAVPFDIDLGSDPFALPDLPDEWKATQVAAPPVEVAPVAPLESVVPPAEPEMSFAPDDMSQPLAPAPVDTFDADMAAPADYEFAPDDFSQPLEEPGNEFIDSLVANGPVDPLDAEVARQSGMTAEQWSDDQIMRGADATNAAADARIESLDDRERDAQDAYFDRKAARASTDRVLSGIQARREALAKEGVNPNGWADSLTGGQSFAAGIMAIASGILAGTTGDTSGVKYITGMIDQNIDMQKDALKREAALLDTQEAGALNKQARLEEDFKELETQRLAAYDVADQRLAAEQVKFDQVGTTAAAIMKGRLEIQQTAAATALKLEKHTLDMEIKRNTEKRAAQKHVKDMRPAGRKQPSISEQLAAREAGATIGPDGMLKFGDVGTKPILSPKARKEAAEADAAEGALVVRDALTREPLGRADTPKAAENAKVAQENWHALERNLKRMEVLEKEIGTTVDNRFLRGADNDARTAEYDALAAQTANAIAKIDDPTSAIRDNERAAIIEERLPGYNTLTGQGPERSKAKAKALRDAARAGVKRHMNAAGIDFDPSTYYDDEEPTGEAPAKSALNAASAHRPAQVPEMKIGVPGNYVDMAPKYTLNDIQVSAPIQAMEGMARAGDTKAAEYLQAIAADTGHPGAKLAADALSRIGAK